MSALLTLEKMKEIYSKILMGELPEEEGRKEIYHLIEENIHEIED